MDLSVSLYLTFFAVLIHSSAGLDTKMFQLTMPNVRPYRVSIEFYFAKNIHMFAVIVIRKGEKNGQGSIILIIAMQHT